jgi:hypothetical protein
MSKQEVAERGISAVASEIAADDLKVSGPDGTPGVDLWVRDSHGRRVPVQVMGASETGFGIHLRYGQVAGVVIVYVWNLNASDPVEFHAMRWPECLAIAERLGWTETNSWAKLRYYVQTKASSRTRAAVRPYRMTRGAWRRLIG